MPQVGAGLSTHSRLSSQTTFAFPARST